MLSASAATSRSGWSKHGETRTDTFQSIEDLWYIVRGMGRFHRLTPDGGAEEAANVASGDALRIPTGYRFWVENMGQDEAVIWGEGPPTPHA